MEEEPNNQNSVYKLINSANFSPLFIQSTSREIRTPEKIRGGRRSRKMRKSRKMRRSRKMRK